LTTAELDANLAVEELYSKYRKLQQQLEFLEVQVNLFCPFNISMN
jgi:hypothetical protein